jgi:sugar lactone lactonase YvrE
MGATPRLWSGRRPLLVGVGLVLSLAFAAPARAEFKFLNQWGHPQGGEVLVPLDVERDNAGNIYVVDILAGVQKYDANGNHLLSFGSFGTGPGEFDTPAGIGVNEATGEVYISDVGVSGGGPTPGMRIERFDSNGNFLGEFGSFGTAEGQFSFLQAIAVDQVSGDVFTAEQHRVQRFSSTGQFELMWGRDVVPGGGTGAETCAAGCKEGMGGSLEGELRSPAGIAVGFNSVFVAEDGNERISRFNQNTGAFQIMGGRDVQPGGGQAGETCVAACKTGISGTGPGELNDPHGLDVNNAFGFLYVVDQGNDRVQRWTPNLGFVSEFGSQGSANGQFEDANGLTENQGTVVVTDVTPPRIQIFNAAGVFQQRFGDPGPATLRIPFGIATGPGGVYVTDLRDRVVRFDAQGTLLDRFGSSGVAPGQFSTPGGLGVSADGHLFVSDRGNARIQRFDPSGNVVGTWGSQGSAPGQFDGLNDVAVAPDGTVYALDSGNARVQKFGPIGDFQGTWGAAGPAPGQFAFPEGMGVDSDGNVYVADTGNDRIQKFDANGNLLTSWGRPGTGDGEFDRPSDVAVDGAGNVYVVDHDNNRVQVFDASTAFRGRFGAAGGDGSIGSAPGEFNQPVSIAVDAPGYIYVLDQFNSRVQRFVATPELALTAAPNQSITAMTVTPACGTGPCQAALSGQLVVRERRKRKPRVGAASGAAERRKRITIALAPAGQTLNAGAAADTPLAPATPGKRFRKAKKLLKKGGKGKVTVSGTATNEAGQVAAPQVTFKLQRG